MTQKISLPYSLIKQQFKLHLTTTTTKITIKHPSNNNLQQQYTNNNFNPTNNQHTCKVPVKTPPLKNFTTTTLTSSILCNNTWGKDNEDSIDFDYQSTDICGQLSKNSSAHTTILP